MPTPYVISLVLAVVALAATRWLVPVPSVAYSRSPLGSTDLLIAAVGVVALAAHCGAMFYPSAVEVVPGTTGLVQQIAALGTASILGFALASALVLFGLRRLHFVPLAVVVLCLTAVGITMYDGGSLDAHLTAIFVAVVVLTIVAGDTYPESAVR